MMSHLGITARVPRLAVGNDGGVGGVDEHTGCIIFLLITYQKLLLFEGVVWTLIPFSVCQVARAFTDGAAVTFVSTDVLLL